MRYVALLRAVNVGGTGVISMADVRDLFARLGFADVATQGASGNVIFTATGAAAAHRRRIEEALSKRLGKPAAAVVRSGAELREVLDEAPFRDDRKDVRRHVAFLDAPRGKSTPARMPSLEITFPSPRAGEVYIEVAASVPRGADPHSFLEKTLGTTATLRTWNVVRKLAELASSPT